MTAPARNEKTMTTLTLAREVTDAVDDFLDTPDLDGTLLHLTVAGSHAYGLSHADSDVDLRGCYAATADKFLGLHAPVLTYEFPPDTVLHELGKVVRLAAASNPNVLETLYSPAVHVHPAFQMVLDQRHLFLSQKTRASFGGFAANQMRKLQAGTGNMQPRRRAKHLLHTFRVLELGQQILTEQTLDLFVNEDDAARFRSYADLSDDAVLAMFEVRIETLDTCDTDLPEDVDYDGLHDLLVAVRAAVTA
jgi:predicted nucleotidyltransferase